MGGGDPKKISDILGGIQKKREIFQIFTHPPPPPLVNNECSLMNGKGITSIPNWQETTPAFIQLSCYLVTFSHVADFLTSRWVHSRKNLSTQRVHKLVIDEKLLN